MRKSELKHLIKSAYSIEAPGKMEFIKKYQRRELNCGELLCLQLQYMGVQLTVIGGYDIFL